LRTISTIGRKRVWLGLLGFSLFMCIALQQPRQQVGRLRGLMQFKHVIGTLASISLLPTLAMLGAKLI